MFKVVYVDYIGEIQAFYIRGTNPDEIKKEFEKNNKGMEVISVTLI